MLKFLAILSLLFSATTHSFAQPALVDTGGAEFNFITKRTNDFGALQKNSKAGYSFEFRNTGNQPLIISAMHSSQNDAKGPDYSVQIKYPQKPVKPGHRGVITVGLTTFEVAGSFKNEIYVSSNATADDFPLLLIYGAVVPESGRTDKAYVPETSAGAAVGAFMINNIKK